ncbi:hypothetical protein KIN20_017786 [Parelaphostrongylus tenuis]|uniref:Uncharacterized protein n=1 Tax=Parelaphostrongylus tenuis TaxID=148309 RepID=A0AAD5MIZ7_PARTN|nr:hypothetical protein KIN20_017786 [Parelaphostrongylus tenuis]
MGKRLAPSLAIAFMSKVEAPVMDLRPLLYRVVEVGQHSLRLADASRYGDDIISKAKLGENASPSRIPLPSRQPRTSSWQNWSRSMWQSVVNRAVRMLASSPFASHFFSAFAAVD